MEQFKNSYAIQVAAEKGNPDAQYLYGLESLKKGKMIRALDNLSAAAAKGQVLAMVEMGRLSLSDFGEHNVEKAESWFKKVEETNDPDASLQLGIIFFSGENIDFDIVRAKRLLQIASAQGRAEADDYLRFLIENELELQKACCGDDVAQYNIGNKYLECNEVNTNQKYTDIALRWITLSANNLNIDAIYQLGKIYQDGKLVSRNLEIAKKWLEQAAARGFSDAVNLLDKILNIEIIQLESSCAAIYEGFLYYDLLNESSARRLSGSVKTINLKDVNKIRYQKYRFNFTIFTNQDEVYFNLNRPQDLKNTTYGDGIVYTLCNKCLLSHCTNENDSWVYSVFYSAVALIVFFINGMFDLDITAPGTPKVEVYSK